MKSINSVYSSPVELLTTDLDSLANGSAALSGVIDNATNRSIFMKVQIKLPIVDLSAQTDPHVLIRLIESIDGGTTFEDNDDKSWGVSIGIAATNAEHIKIGDMEIPPGKFKLAVVNKTGAGFAASGNVLSYVTFTPETAE
jgi:hypothetical protein